MSLLLNLIKLGDGLSKCVLTLWVTWWVSIKRQELPTFRVHLGSHPFGGVRVAHRFSFLVFGVMFCLFSFCILCLVLCLVSCSVSCVVFCVLCLVLCLVSCSVSCSVSCVPNVARVYEWSIVDCPFDFLLCLFQY